MGRLFFIDLRDRSGIIQMVIVDSKLVENIKPEYVIEVKGKVKKRPEKLVNPNLETGKVEIEVEKIKNSLRIKRITNPN